MLASAGLPLPTDLYVHDYLTVGGQKISKSLGNTIDPAALAAAYGADALRWWLLRDVPRVGDADFTVDRLAARANDELTNGIGNLVNRVVAMIHRYRGGQDPAAETEPPGWAQVDAARRQAAALVDAALANADFRSATTAVWAIADEANRYVSQIRPWELARAEQAGDDQAGRRLDAVLQALIGACNELASHLEPFLPDAAGRLRRQLAQANGQLPSPVPVFARLAIPRP